MHNSIKTVLKTFFSVIILFLFSCSNSEEYIMKLDVKSFPSRTQDFSLWQLKPFFHEVQMGYIIKTDDDRITVIDGGLPQSIKTVTEYIQQFGGHVHTWVTTHPHLDHIGVLQEAIYQGEIKIDRILHSKLDEDWTFKNESEGAALASNYYKNLDESGISIIDVKKGDLFSVGDGVDLQIIAIKNDSITLNAINNSSLIFKIKSKSKSVLFLGDLGVEGGDAILKSTDHQNLKADYVQMAHHGQNGVGLELYKAVNADYALWPTPKWLWENKAPNQGPGTGKYQTPEVRGWVKNELGIKKSYVAGLEGNVQID